jgi:hypothetical protein
MTPSRAFIQVTGVNYGPDYRFPYHESAFHRQPGIPPHRLQVDAPRGSHAPQGLPHFQVACLEGLAEIRPMVRGDPMIRLF